jgi:hypothetical protein
MEDPKRTDIPYKIYVKAKHNTTIFPQEIIARGEGNTYWITTKKQNFQLTKKKQYYRQMNL